jgi:hypothetical protein
MAAGTQVNPSAGAIIQFANDTITSGITRSLLTAFTDVSGATPGSGNTMYPSQGSSNNPRFVVGGGTYAGSYYINRNGTQGASYWSTFVSTGSKMDLNNFHSYVHWTTDQRLEISFQDNAPPSMYYDFNIRVAGGGMIFSKNGIPSTGGGGYNPNGLDYYRNFSGSSYSSGFSPGSPNTGWTLAFNIDWNAASPPHTFFQLDLLIVDYHTGETLYYNSPVLIGDAGTPASSSAFSDSVYIDYWRCPSFQFVLN